MTQLNHEARETLRWAGITPGQWAKRHGYESAKDWRGDECGCTDDRCIGVMGGDGVQVDWINPEPESDLQPETAQQEGGAWAFITYGRVPAVELVVPASVALEPAALLTAIGPAVAQAPAERHCLTFTDQTID